MDTNNHRHNLSAAAGLLALSPVALFLTLYLAVSVAIGDFYKMPLSVALAASSVWAVAIFRHRRLTDRIEVFSRAAGHTNILYMIWIFVLAGAFATLARHVGAVDSTVALIVRAFPPQYLAPMLFVASCFISFSIGTSVGTIVALTPLAVDMASSTGVSVPFLTAVVLGGAFFGDNLSFISDTTIAATRSLGVRMDDKFKVNLWIALPAAIITLVFYMLAPEARVAPEATISAQASGSPWLMLPYLVVIATAIAGINVTVVLCLGIAAACVAGALSGHSFIDMATFMGEGIDSMGNLIVITLLAAGMLGIIKACGGIDYLIDLMTARVKGLRATQGVIALLVSLVNLCTANNTVAIITVGPMARDIAGRVGIDPRKTASLLDSASCVVQCLIPYGAQTLLATSLAGISPVAPFSHLYYPWALAMMVLLSIIFRFPRKVAGPVS